MPTNEFCADLCLLDPSQHPYAGGKAKNLSVVSGLGFNVPPGTCLLSRAYSQHLSDHGISTVMPQDDQGALSDGLSTLRAAIREAPLSPLLEEAVAAAYPGGTVAVRSSATAEDLPEASFAGQYDTILNVTSLAHCLRAVKQCWASLWTERAYHYRVENQIDHAQVEMAVIIQQQVDADMAGVAFSMDPITGSRLRIVIEACQGLGDALVSGQVTPERWVWRKPDLKLLWRDAVEGMALNRRVARRMVRQVRDLERQLDAPQDVEWAVRNRTIFILQARAITTLPAAKSWEQKQVWTNLNTGEVVPDVVTPMTWSLLSGMLFPLFRTVFGLLSADITRAPVMGLVAGRVYFNLTTVFSTGYPLWLQFARGEDVHESLTQAMGGHQGALDIDIAEEDLSDMGFTWFKFVCSVPRSLWAFYRHRPKRVAGFLTAFQAHNCDQLALDPENLSLEALARQLCQTMEEDLRHWDLMFLISSGLALPVLDKACRDWFPEQDASRFLRLFAAQGGMADTEAGLDLWRLAVLARQDPVTEQQLLSEEHWDGIRAQLDPAFLEAWDAFMKAHGHHGRGELEFMNARWREQPEYIRQLIKSYLHSVDQIDPLERQEKLAAERASLVQACRSQLRNPIKRGIFNWAVAVASQLSCDRENWKNEAVRWIATLRTWLQVLGRGLHARDVLAAPEDVFFLTLEELEIIAQGGPNLDFTECIAQRRAHYEWNQAQHPAPVVVGPFDPDTHTARPVNGDISELKGVGASPGIVTGPARVIMRTDEHQTVACGEILVAPFTDPAWTPYFVPAAGVVMDLGGVLSHGSIIAREYGLPAVVNVACATEVIQTGQIIEVDGTLGIVRVLKEQGNPQNASSRS